MEGMWEAVRWDSLSSTYACQSWDWALECTWAGLKWSRSRSCRPLSHPGDGNRHFLPVILPHSTGGQTLPHKPNSWSHSAPSFLNFRAKAEEGLVGRELVRDSDTGYSIILCPWPSTGEKPKHKSSRDAVFRYFLWKGLHRTLEIAEKTGFLRD